LAYPASLARLVRLVRVQIGDHAFGYTVLVSFSSADCCENEGVYQRYLAFASLQLMTSLAVGRTIANPKSRLIDHDNLAYMREYMRRALESPR